MTGNGLAWAQLAPSVLRTLFAHAALFDRGMSANAEPMNESPDKESKPMHLQSLAIMASAVAFTALAAEPPATLMQQIQGVYKQRFPSGTIDGKETWTAEDIVEIVPMGPHHVYFRAELEFANGHICSLSGAAAYEEGGFVYRDTEYDAVWKQRCTLRVRLTDRSLQLTDVDTKSGEATCRMYCGMRGSFSDYRIARSTRRTIRYLSRLRASPQYQNALGQTAPPEKTRP